MAHIHEKIDFTVAIYVVRDGKILLIHHRKLDKWLPLGGHIELDEEPEQAALREAKEESGLDVELLGERPPTTGGDFHSDSLIRRDRDLFFVSNAQNDALISIAV